MKKPDFLQALLRGDGPAIEQFYSEHFPAIRELVRKQGGSEADAKDIFQDGILVCRNAAASLISRIEKTFGGFFYKTCRNLCLNLRTKKSTISEITLSDDAKHIAGDDGFLSDDELLKIERGRLFWKAYRQLGDDCQKLLELFFQSVPMETITEKLGISSVVNARRQKFVCKKKLIEMIKNAPEFEELN